MAVLECAGLSKSYGAVKALEDIDLKVEPGRVVGLLGPNGSGKTTLIKLANGLLQPSAGRILVCGREPGPETKAEVSYMPERLEMPEWTRVRRLADFFADFYADFDRARAAELLERLEVGLLVLPDVEEEDPLRREITALAEEKGIETLFLAEDADVTFGESALRIYAPLGSGGANEEGLSVLCTAGDFDGLITGDMNDTVEKRLVKYGSLPDLELLVAGHHGSKYATSEELLLATRPELAVISVGYNTYGHPAPETLERLAAAGCAIYRTDWSGTVTITAK